MRVAVIALLLAAAALGAAGAARAADCRVTGWTSGYGGAPIFDCSEQSR